MESLRNRSLYQLGFSILLKIFSEIEIAQSAEIDGLGRVQLSMYLERESRTGRSFDSAENIQRNRKCAAGRD